MGVFLMRAAAEFDNSGKSPVPIWLAGSLFIVMALGILYSFSKQVPVIKISPAGIYFKSLFRDQHIDWNEIDSVSYTGKEPLRFILRYPMEAIRMTLNSGKKVVIFYEYYSNSHLLKQFIDSHLRTAKPPLVTEDHQPSAFDMSDELFRVYKGHPFLSMRGVFIWGFFLILSVPVFRGGRIHEKSVLPLLSMFSLWYLGNGYFCHYIKISDNYLQIRNYYLPWIRRSFLLSDVTEIVIETKDKWPNCIRIITRSHRSRLYPAGTLNDSDWKELMDEFRSKGIRVRNECVY
ncbi:hypothetical protein [Arcticibacter tournemirensis]|uniref:Uncharacterized protein n=1 Tax=Arcticibacter tournemirensis TaxID=699437 RepID=A0A4Q0MH14_9SPHI|nr:hypothetical protein [Arcticibacter tournemirensis]RXF72289.1 hypothetical protein EKH83_00755 [Arcticibacter tournemirensis]